MHPQDRLRAVVWQVLRRGYARLLAAQTGRQAAALTEAEASLLVDPHLDALQHDFRAICEALAEAQRVGAEHVHGVLHALPSLEPDDHDLLDEAVEWSATQAREGLDEGA